MGVAQTYLRCNGGHYFLGAVCPFDGWSSDDSERVAEVVRCLAAAQQRPSMDLLRQAGVPAEALERVLIIEFGSDDAAFEALDPAGYLVDGAWTPLRAAKPGLK